MCIEGPNEPACMDAFLMPLIESLLRLAPPQPRPPAAAAQQQPNQPQPAASSTGSQAQSTPGGQQLADARRMMALSCAAGYADKV
jgi:hypothetical protein